MRYVLVCLLERLHSSSKCLELFFFLRFLLITLILHQLLHVYISRIHSCSTNSLHYIHLLYRRAVLESLVDTQHLQYLLVLLCILQIEVIKLVLDHFRGHIFLSGEILHLPWIKQFLNRKGHDVLVVGAR